MSNWTFEQTVELVKAYDEAVAADIEHCDRVGNRRWNQYGHRACDIFNQLGYAAKDHPDALAHSTGPARDRLVAEIRAYGNDEERGRLANARDRWAQADRAQRRAAKARIGKLIEVEDNKELKHSGRFMLDHTIILMSCPAAYSQANVDRYMGALNL